MNENLGGSPGGGPGGGPDWAPTDLEGYYKDITSKGAGAFYRSGDNPPQNSKSPTSQYLSPAHKKKMMLKKMKCK